jgi:endonuclease/exonuclease/phosphatase family metal-dependent hydrolase
MANLVTVAAWNVGHRTTRKHIPEELGAALEHLGTDVIFLTEFVEEGFGRDALLKRLDAAGYEHVHMTKRLPRHNQVFIASRLPFDIGDIAAPAMDSHATANFLHVRMHDRAIELIGIRAPAYKTGAEKHSYWREVDGILHGVQDRALIAAGDFNEDPFKGVSETFTSRRFHGSETLRVEKPVGPWSYMNPHKEASRSRIDHVLHTPRVEIRDARYHYEVEGIRLAGPGSSAALSDHAVLTFAAATQ